MYRILYIGGFEMPDKNAAAHRVLSIAKALKDYDCEVLFYGITHENINKITVDGFNCEAICYPTSVYKWMRYALGMDIIRVVEKCKPDFVFCYNYPSVAQWKVIRYCRLHNIKVVGDITEWYNSGSFLKKMDIGLRMRIVNRKLDGVICISRYLYDYYSRCKAIYIPPLVDLNEKKWLKKDGVCLDGRVRLVYVGSPGRKDRIDCVVKAFQTVYSERLALDVVGVTKEQFQESYPNLEVTDDRVRFWGRVPHDKAIEKLKESDFQLFFRDNTRVNNAGFPTKYVESVSAGVAVITNRYSNVCDYLKDGVNGFVVDEITDESLVRVLIKVSSLSSDDIVSMKKNSRQISFDYRLFSRQLWSFIQTI